MPRLTLMKMTRTILNVGSQVPDENHRVLTETLVTDGQELTIAVGEPD
jgi:hypothetical protein